MSKNKKEGYVHSLGWAIDVIQHGGCASRLGWNGKNQYIELAKNVSYVSGSTGDVVNVDHTTMGNMAIAFVGTSGVQLGWLASQADLLSMDWGYFIEGEQ